MGRVDLRGGRVAAIGGDIVQSVFTQTVLGTRLRSAVVAASEGSTAEAVRVLALGADDRAGALVHNISEKGPDETRLLRLSPDGCVALEVDQTLVGTGADEGAESETFTATALAVDDLTVALARPGEGIVRHEFAPLEGCERPNSG